MAIRDEQTASLEILRDARYHAAALTADPRTADLVAGVKAADANLRRFVAQHEEKQGERMAKLAVLERTDFELDDRLRLVELDVLAEVKKDRSSTNYRAIFPRGLSALLSLRGEGEARAVLALLAALRERLPALGTTYADLEALCSATIDAEKAWKQTEADAAKAFGEELIARIELVRQLQKNEGALIALYPGQRRRVRSFFRPTRRRAAAADTGAPEPSSPME